MVLNKHDRPGNQLTDNHASLMGVIKLLPTLTDMPIGYSSVSPRRQQLCGPCELEQCKPLSTFSTLTVRFG